MKTLYFWYLTAALGLTTALGCGNETTSDDVPQASANVESEEQASSEPASQSASAVESTAESSSGAPVSFESPPPVGTRARCPVMGNEFTVSEDTERSEHQGRHYAFCCAGCKPRFDANPQEFISDQS